MTDPSQARLRLAGSILRSHREALKLTLADAARMVELDRSAISRIETGRRGIRPAYLRILLDEYAVPEATRTALHTLTRRSTGWQAAYRGILPAPYLDFLAAENAASKILTYAPARFPVLLQSLSYAQALADADREIAMENKRPAAEAPRLRQNATLHQRGTRLTAIIGEAALHHAAADQAVYADQLAHLAKAATSPNITIRLMPFTAGPVPAAGSGEFTILQFGNPADFSLVYLTSPGGGTTLDDLAAVTACQAAFTWLDSMALTSSETTRRLHLTTKAATAA